MAHSAALIVGGRSLRMGKDKATLLLRGQPLWQRQLETLRTTSPDHMYLSVGRNTVLSSPGVERVEDRVADAGPLAGIEAVLAHQSSRFLLVLAVDLPLMTSDFLQTLLDACRPGCGRVPKVQGQTEPLAAVYPREALAVARECLDQGMYTLRSFIDRCVEECMLRLIEVSGEDAELFLNVNRETDWPPDRR